MQYYKSIGIIGHLGMVGATTLNFFRDEGYEVYGYDIREPASKEKAFNADLIFICVPTPFDWGKDKFDGSIVEETLNLCNEKSVIVVKSTVMIGTIDQLQSKHPNKKLLFNPEFLSEATCDNDFRNPDRQFVGYTEQSYSEAIKVLNTLPESAYGAIMPAKEAELLKYINNIHGCIEIMESNLWWEICQKEGLNYENVLKSALASKWVGVPMGRHYRVIFHKGKRGFGGKCFPKDINAYIEYLNKSGIDAQLPNAVREMNKRILKEQDLNEEQSEKL